SLDERDADPVSFWTYAIAALQRAVPGIGEVSLSLFQSPQLPPADIALAPLLNELFAVAGDLVLVLDDFHAVEGRDVQEGLAFLFGHLPPRIPLGSGTHAGTA